MSLRDEVRTSDPAYTHTFSRVQENKKLSDEIARQMQEFEAKGGQVTVGRIGEVAVDRYITNEFSGKNDADRRLAASKAGGAVHKRASMASKFMPTGFDNIFRSSVNHDKFVGILGKKISPEFPTIHDARNWVTYELRALKNAK